MEQSVSEVIDVVIEVIGCSVVLGFLTFFAVTNYIQPILDGLIPWT